MSHFRCDRNKSFHPSRALQLGSLSSGAPLNQFFGEPARKLVWRNWFPHPLAPRGGRILKPFLLASSESQAPTSPTVSRFGRAAPQQLMAAELEGEEAQWRRIVCTKQSSHPEPERRASVWVRLIGLRRCFSLIFVPFNRMIIPRFFHFLPIKARGVSAGGLL